MLLALEGFSYDGPEATIGFAPKLNPEKFESFFTSAQDWGNITQTRGQNNQSNTISLCYGNLRLQKFQTEVLKAARTAKLLVNGKAVPLHYSMTGTTLTATFATLKLKAGDHLSLQTTY